MYCLLIYCLALDFFCNFALRCVVLYCRVVYCIVMCCVVLCCVVLFCVLCSVYICILIDDVQACILYCAGNFCP